MVCSKHFFVLYIHFVFFCFLLHGISEFRFLPKKPALKQGEGQEHNSNVNLKRNEAKADQRTGVGERFSRFAKNNTVIVAICNKGMAVEWLQQWYVSARRSGIDNVVVIATDSEAFTWMYERIGERAIHIRDITPLVEGARWNKKNKVSMSTHNQAFNYRSNEYERIVIQRATILSKILQISDLDIIYSDSDIHWIRDPVQHLIRTFSNFDICLQREKGDELGDNNCSGFMYLRNTETTRLFLKAWEFYIKRRMKKKGFFTDQYEINHLLRDFKLGKLPRRYSALTSTLRAATFDWDEFPNGKNYFSERLSGKGVSDSTCQSKMCKHTIWKDLQLDSRKFENRQKNAYLVHHNFAKTNAIKISRAKKVGLWLFLEQNVWQ